LVAKFKHNLITYPVTELLMSAKEYTEQQLNILQVCWSSLLSGWNVCWLHRILPPGESHSIKVRKKMGQTNRRQTITLSLLLYAANVITVLMLKWS